MALDRIIDAKREAVAIRKRARPLSSFQNLLEPSSRSLEASLRRPRTGFILECKKASPSQGLIRPDFDPARIAASYAPFADGISVLTDGPFFQGELSFLREVERGSGRRIPILCKDFVLEPYQIYEARHHGADAVLLMCSVLDDEALRTCLSAAAELSVDALVEVHDESELVRALRTDATIIGINNRNLKTLEVDIATTRELAPLVPSDRVAVCESGIHHHHEVLALRDQVSAFLVGSSLMRQPELDRAVRELVFGRVKICGITRADDARAAHEQGAVYGGIVFWSGSKRAVDVTRARDIMAGAPLSWVGVFVDAPPAQVAGSAAELNLDVVQLHGQQSDDEVAQTRARVPDGCEVWRAARAREGTTLPTASEHHADRLLVDAYDPMLPGGTGKSFDWKRIEGRPDRAELILSGGIGPDNATRADGLGCWALDLSSSVESAPGQKDATTLEHLFAALRGEREETTA